MQCKSRIFVLPEQANSIQLYRALNLRSCVCSEARPNNLKVAICQCCVSKLFLLPQHSKSLLQVYTYTDWSAAYPGTTLYNAYSMIIMLLVVVGAC